MSVDGKPVKQNSTVTFTCKVFLPGVMSSAVECSDTQIWPSSAAALLIFQLALPGSGMSGQSQAGKYLFTPSPSTLPSSNMVSFIA